MQEDSEASPRRSNADRRAATRAALIAAAREAFIEHGYAGAGTPAIVKRAAVTRGALYHHFEDKADLLRAVAGVEAEAVAAEIRTAGLAQSDNPAAALLAGANAYLEAMAKPGRARLLLVEAPAGLSAAEARDIASGAGEAELKAGLEAAGVTENLNAVTTIMSAAFDRAALAIAEGEDQAVYAAAFAQLLEGMVGRS